MLRHSVTEDGIGNASDLNSIEHGLLIVVVRSNNLSNKVDI